MKQKANTLVVLLWNIMHIFYHCSNVVFRLVFWSLFLTCQADRCRVTLSWKWGKMCSPLPQRPSSSQQERKDLTSCGAAQGRPFHRRHAGSTRLRRCRRRGRRGSASAPPPVGRSWPPSSWTRYAGSDAGCPTSVTIKYR